MLSISGLVAGYDNKGVVTLEKLQLEKGGQCLLTGASGCGKTTLLYAIAGLLPVMRGDIMLNATHFSSLSQSQCDHFRSRHIGIIFQTLHLVKSLSVINNVLLGSYMAQQRQDKHHAQKVLTQLGVGDKKNLLPHRLSQGQAQRVAIARALLHKPALILADEPTSSLDDEAAHAVITLLKHVASETGAMLIISTHDARIKTHFSQVIALEKKS